MGGEHGELAHLLSAGLPAVGTAIFGIRFQGDFGGSAVRSRSTANTLRAIEAQLATDKATSAARPISSSNRPGDAGRPRRMATGQSATGIVGRLASKACAPR